MFIFPKISHHTLPENIYGSILAYSDGRLEKTPLFSFLMLLFFRRLSEEKNVVFVYFKEFFDLYRADLEC